MLVDNCSLSDSAACRAEQLHVFRRAGCAGNEHLTPAPNLHFSAVPCSPGDQLNCQGLPTRCLPATKNELRPCPEAEISNFQRSASKTYHTTCTTKAQTTRRRSIHSLHAWTRFLLRTYLVTCLLTIFVSNHFSPVPVSHKSL